MKSDLFLKFPFLFVKPLWYFKEVVNTIEYSIKDIVILISIIIASLLVLHLWQTDVFVIYGIGSKSVGYILAFLLGLGFSFVFQTFILTIILRKLQQAVHFNKVGAVVAIGLSVRIIFQSVLMLSSDIGGIIVPIQILYSSILLIIGLVGITQLRWYKSLICVFLMWFFQVIVFTLVPGYPI